MTLAEADAKRLPNITIKVQTDSIRLTADQKSAMESNPMIDVSAGPLALAEFGGVAAKDPSELTAKASVMIPYKAADGLREGEWDAFAWNEADKTWRLAGCALKATGDQHFEVATDTEVYPALHALLAKPIELRPIAVFKKKALKGPSRAALDTPKPAEASKLVKGVDVKENAGFFFITTSQLEVTIEKATGAIYRYRVLRPTLFDFTSEGLGGLKVYLVNKTKNTGGFFDAADSIDFSKQNFQNEDYLVLDIALRPGAEYLATVAKAHLQYRIGADMSFVKTDVTFLKDDPSKFEVGVYQRYNALDWERQVFGTIAETLERPSVKKCFARYSDLVEDETQPKTDEDYFADNSAGRQLRFGCQGIQQQHDRN